MLVRLAVLIAVLAVLSGVQYAHAQTLDEGAPLFLKSVDPADTLCNQLSTGTATFTLDGLSSVHTIVNALNHSIIAYIEVTASSTGKSIAVYNYTIPGTLQVGMDVSIDVLKSISANPYRETYTIRPVQEIIELDGLGSKVRFINHTGITFELYKTFKSLAADTGGLITPGGVDELVTNSAGTISTAAAMRADPPGVETCYTSSAQIVGKLIGPPVSTGNPFVRQIDSTATSACTASVTPQMVSTYTSAGLDVTMDLGNPAFINTVVRAELKSITNVRDASLALYNFTHDNGVYKFTFPNADLIGITSTPATDAFTIRLVSYTFTLVNDPAPVNAEGKLIQIPGITIEDAATFDSFASGLSVIVSGNEGTGNADLVIKHFADGSKRLTAATLGSEGNNCYVSSDTHDAIPPTLPKLGRIATTLKGTTPTLPDVTCTDNRFPDGLGADPVSHDLAAISSASITGAFRDYPLDYECDDGRNTAVSGTVGTLRVYDLLPAALLGETAFPVCAVGGFFNPAGTILINSTLNADGSLHVIVPYSELVQESGLTHFEITADNGKVLSVYDYEVKDGKAIFTVPNVGRVSTDLDSFDVAKIPHVAAVYSYQNLNLIGSSTPLDFRVITNPAIHYLHYLQFDRYKTDTGYVLVNATLDSGAEVGDVLAPHPGGKIDGAVDSSSLPGLQCAVMKEQGQHRVRPTIEIANPVETITVSSTGTFADLTTGATCKFNPLEADKPADIIDAKTDVDVTTLKIGYVVTYGCTDRHGNYAERAGKVDVVDDLKPDIQIKTGTGATDLNAVNMDYTHNLEINAMYVEFGAVCVDNHDGAITVAAPTGGPVVTTTVAEFPLVYRCEDAAGNSQEVTRLVKIADTEKPTVTVNQYRGVDTTTQNVVVDKTYVDIGATCNDNLDSYDGTAATPVITESGSIAAISTAAVTTYKISYVCNDGTTGDVTETDARTLNIVADETAPEVTSVAPSAVVKTFSHPDSPYVEEGATCKDKILTTTEELDDIHANADGNADGYVDITVISTTYTHFYLGEVPRVLVEHAGTTDVKYECTDEFSNRGEADLELRGGSDAGAVILPKNYTRHDPPNPDAGRGDLILNLGEIYDEAGAHCLFVANGGQDAEFGGDRVIVTTPGTYTVTYTCTGTGTGEGQNVAEEVTALPANRIVTVNTIDEKREEGPQYTFGKEGKKKDFPTYASFKLDHIVGTDFDSTQVNCTIADLSEKIIPKIRAIPFSVVYMPDDAEGMEYLKRMTNGGPVEDFIKQAPVGRYEIQYDCNDVAAQLERRVALDLRILLPRSGGDSNDWQLNPTFGRSWESNAQLVSQGFSFNGRTFDVTDNYHVDYERTTSEIGQTNTATIKAYSEVALDTVSLSLGVPDLSRISDAESEIHVKLGLNYENPAEYDLVDIIHEQDDPLVDPESTSVSIEKIKCNSLTELMCHQFTIQFRIMAPLMSDVLAISAMDIDRRITTTYINDGVEFTGESLLPAETATLQFKRGNQHPVDTIILTQEDRRYNIWSDQHGFVWLKNSYDSWFQMTHADFERLQDPTVTVMTRTNSNFEDMIQHERERAKLVFDAETIKSQVGESFSHAAPVRIDKLSDPIILEKLKVAELAALQYLESHR